MRALYDKCIAWVNHITPDGVTVYVRDQNAPKPDNPAVTLRIGGTREIAHHRAGIDPDTDTQPVTRWMAFTLALEVYAENVIAAEEIAATLMDHIYNAEARIDIMGRSVAFSNILSGPTTISAAIGPMIEDRVSIDLQMSATRDLTYDIGPIENVEFSGDVGEHTISRTVSAPSP